MRAPHREIHEDVRAVSRIAHGSVPNCGRDALIRRFNGRVLLAIHGRSRNAIYAVGERGLILRFNGSSGYRSKVE